VNLKLDIALTHLKARKRQTLVSVLGVAMGVGFFIAIASLMQGFERSRTPAAGPLPMPVRVLWGGGDRSHRPTLPESVKALAPNAEVEVIPTAGHSPELEHPDRLLALV